MYGEGVYMTVCSDIPICLYKYKVTFNVMLSLVLFKCKLKLASHTFQIFKCINLDMGRSGGVNPSFGSSLYKSTGLQTFFRGSRIDMKLQLNTGVMNKMY